MFCPNCGNNLPEGSNFCGSCGANLSVENAQPVSQTTVNSAPSKIDGAGAGVCILSFLFPVVGLILHLVNKKTRPLYAKTVGRLALIGFIVGFVSSCISLAVGSGDGSSDNVSTTSNQYDFGETPTVGIRDNVETMVFEVNNGVISSKITFSYEDDVIIRMQGDYNVYDLTVSGTEIAKTTIENTYDAVQQADLYNITMTVEPGYNTINCDFNFSSLDGTNGKASTILAANFIGLTMNTDGKMYMSTVKSEMIAFGYELVDTY